MPRAGSSVVSANVQATTYRDVKASGIRVRVSDVGAGPTLLLLHTLLLSRREWDALVEHLGSQFRIVAPDLPGFGESEKPSQARFAYTVDAFAHVVADLFAGLDMRQACVVGHGLGGAIAIRLASSHPELVSRLVLVDALCHPTRPELTRHLVRVPIVGSFVLKQLWGYGAFARYFQRVLVAKHSNVSRQRIREFYEQFDPPSARDSALVALRHTQDTRSVRAALSRIGAPTLVVWGRYDALCSATFGQLLAREVRNASFALLDTGHSPPLEAGAQLAGLVQRFAASEQTAAPAVS